MAKGWTWHGLTFGERFWAKIKLGGADECWEWQACRDSCGYGVIRDQDGKHNKAHRISYELLAGPIPKGLEIDHICHNRACVNPKHLRLCSHAENMRNQVRPINNTTGFKGVTHVKRLNLWRAQIMFGWEKITLGYYTTPNSAHIAYRNAARTYYGEFANFGEV